MSRARSSFDLSPTGTENPPAFQNTLACQDWLAGVPLANPTQAQVMLLRQLNLLANFTMPPGERLAILELLRVAISDVQTDVAKRFAGRPLPLTPPEQAALDGTLVTWQALLAGYLRLIDAAHADDPTLHKHRALVSQRALAVFADWQVDLLRGQELPDADYWRTLHRVFSLAEEMGVLVDDVHDAPRHGNTATTALGAYGESVLLYTASPFELPPRHLNWIARWSRRWGGKLGLAKTEPTVADDRSIPLFVDLATDRPPSYHSQDGQAPRWLDTGALRKSIKGRIVLLEQGEQPSRLHLGEDCTQPAAGQLLNRVYMRWCKGGATRRQIRKAASGGCEFIVGLNAVHYYLSDRQPFNPPTRDETVLRQQREEMETFGERARRKDDDYSDRQGFDIEQWSVIDDWQLLDRSTGGLRLSRPLKGGVRVGTGQLVAVKLAGSAQFIVGGVRWALQDAVKASHATLSIGVQLYPGVAQPMAVRATDVRDPFRQGLYLPAVAAVGEPESLIVPAGTVRIGRAVEIVRGRESTACKLVKVLDRTTEYERCTFGA